MRRWQVTAILVALAGAGASLAAGLPVGVVAIDSGRAWVVAALERLGAGGSVGAPVDPDVLPLRTDGRTVAPEPIPELTDPWVPPPPVIRALPPDPAPVVYGCGGPVPEGHAAVACGMG